MGAGRSPLTRMFISPENITNKTSGGSDCFLCDVIEKSGHKYKKEWDCQHLCLPHCTHTHSHTHRGSNDTQSLGWERTGHFSICQPWERPTCHIHSVLRVRQVVWWKWLLVSSLCFVYIQMCIVLYKKKPCAYKLALQEYPVVFWWKEAWMYVNRVQN